MSDKPTPGPMDNLIQLTEWESGYVMHLDPSTIHLMQRLQAHVYSLPGHEPEMQELGERTKLVAGGDTMLVRETPEEIFQLAKAKGVPPDA